MYSVKYNSSQHTYRGQQVHQTYKAQEQQISASDTSLLINHSSPRLNVFSTIPSFSL